MDAAAEHHVVAAALQHHVEEEEVPLGVVHHDIVADNSWVGVDHDYMLQVLLHAGNFGVVVDRVDEAAVEQVLLHRVANYCSIREVVVAADIEVEDRSSQSCCRSSCSSKPHRISIGS